MFEANRNENEREENLWMHHPLCIFVSICNGTVCIEEEWKKKPRYHKKRHCCAYIPFTLEFLKLIYNTERWYYARPGTLYTTRYVEACLVYDTMDANAL